MTRTATFSLFLGLVLSLGCGGPKATDTKNDVKDNVPQLGPDPDYAELDVGADYKSYTKLNKEGVLSKTHGSRFVDTYVNDVGLEAYKSGEGEIPVGTVIVKTSWETKDGVATDVPGPIFVMKKTDSAENEGWWYALHWADVPASWQTRMKATKVYWRSPSKKVGYCVDCHDAFDNQLGGIPEDKRNY